MAGRVKEGQIDCPLTGFWGDESCFTGMGVVGGCLLLLSTLTLGKFLTGHFQTFEGYFALRQSHQCDLISHVLEKIEDNRNLKC
jgi:hypothetical protein